MVLTWYFREGIEIITYKLPWIPLYKCMLSFSYEPFLPFPLVQWKGVSLSISVSYCISYTSFYSLPKFLEELSVLLFFLSLNQCILMFAHLSMEAALASNGWLRAQSSACLSQSFLSILLETASACFRSMATVILYVKSTGFTVGLLRFKSWFQPLPVGCLYENSIKSMCLWPTGLWWGLNC